MGRGRSRERAAGTSRPKRLKLGEKHGHFGAHSVPSQSAWMIAYAGAGQLYTPKVLKAFLPSPSLRKVHRKVCLNLLK